MTFGLGYHAKSPRINAAVEPYPGRWTHHVLISGTGEVDEVIRWLTGYSQTELEGLLERSVPYGDFFRMTDMQGTARIFGK